MRNIFFFLSKSHRGSKLNKNIRKETFGHKYIQVFLNTKGILNYNKTPQIDFTTWNMTPAAISARGFWCICCVFIDGRRWNVSQEVSL